MLDIANARGDIYNKNTKKAKNDLQKAISHINIIDNLRPTDEIINHVKVAKKHLQYESTQEVGQDLIPIAYDINQLTFAMPTQNAREHLKNARKALSLGNKKEALKELSSLEEAVSITGLYLPVNQTKAYIYQALKELKLNNLQKADTILKKAEHNLVVISITGIKPIEKAKKSFYRAMVDYSHGAYAKSKEDLHNSALWLNKAMHSSNKKVRQEAKKLKEKTNTLKNELSGKTLHAKAKLHELWAESKALSERDINSVSNKFSSFKKQSKFKTDLLDARLHLEYAKARQFIYGTKQETKSELNKASLDLKKASKYSDAKTKKSLQIIEKSINNLKENISNKSDIAKKKYEVLKTKITNLL